MQLKTLNESAETITLLQAAIARLNKKLQIADYVDMVTSLYIIKDLSSLVYQLFVVRLCVHQLTNKWIFSSESAKKMCPHLQIGQILASAGKRKIQKKTMERNKKHKRNKRKEKNIYMCCISIKSLSVTSSSSVGCPIILNFGSTYRHTL